MISNYVKTLPPHIRSSDSIPKRIWIKVAALFPTLIAATFLFRVAFLRVWIILLLVSLGTEFVARKCLNKKHSLYDGEAVWIACLLALMLPPELPLWMAMISALVAVLIGKECFGGLGSYLFYPPLVGYGFLQVSFPQAMAAPVIFNSSLSYIFLITLILGGGVLIGFRQVRLEMPWVFLTLCLGGLMGLGRFGAPLFSINLALLTAFFLITDSVTTPLTKKGHIGFILGVAILTVLLSSPHLSFQAVCFAFLTMNLFTPWIDVWTKPIPHQKAGRALLTYKTRS